MELISTDYIIKNDTKKDKLETKLRHYIGKAIDQFKLISPGDRVLVCVSGGKDSMTMLQILHKLQLRAKGKFYIEGFTLDQSQPGWDASKVKEFIEKQNIPYNIIKKDTYSIVKEKIPEGKTYCSLCSRLRRGNIYNYAKNNNFNKIALGHHRDDLITTLLMSIFYNGIIKSMPPKLKTDDGQNTVIRPLVYCQEKDIAEYAKLSNFPIIPCNLCGSQDNLSRKKVSELIKVLAKDNPKIPSNMLHALSNVTPSHLMDRDIFNFDLVN